jgi:muramoyltetrapeptide carboxypeptidase
MWKGRMHARRVRARNRPLLKAGDSVRVVSLSRNLSMVSKPVLGRASIALAAVGLDVSFGRSAFAAAERRETPRTSTRIRDFNSALNDEGVAGILSCIGGYFANELLPLIDYGAMARSPKVICGYSDVTVILNAITHVTGVVTYLGPHFSSFGMHQCLEYIRSSFVEATFQRTRRQYVASEGWSDGAWFAKTSIQIQGNSGPFGLQQGTARGRLVGGNLNAFSRLFGTPYMPDLAGKILLVEVSDSSGGDSDIVCAQLLTTLLLQPGGAELAGILVGRFSGVSDIDAWKLRALVQRLPIDPRTPILAGLDFGHTMPIATFPIGGMATVRVGRKRWELEF